MKTCFDANDFRKEMNVSRETLDLFSKWKTVLEESNQNINLVSDKSLKEFWFRHAYDSAQIQHFLPERAEFILDFGSGAGFPALALAILSREKRQRKFVLIDSRKKKIAFLERLTKELQLTNLHPQAIRIEDLSLSQEMFGEKKNRYPVSNPALRKKITSDHKGKEVSEKQKSADSGEGEDKKKHSIEIIKKKEDKFILTQPVEVITARACASLPQLLGYAFPLWSSETQAVFLKGENVESEIKAALKNWTFDFILRPSLTCAQARIILIKNLRKK